MSTPKKRLALNNSEPKREVRESSEPTSISYSLNSNHNCETPETGELPTLTPLEQVLDDLNNNLDIAFSIQRELYAMTERYRTNYGRDGEKNCSDGAARSVGDSPLVEKLIQVNERIQELIVNQRDLRADLVL